MILWHDRRRAFLRRAAFGGAVLLLGGGLGTSALAATQPLVVRRRVLALPGWPEDAGALRVVFVTDLHVGSPGIDLAELGRIAELVNAQRPDLVLLGGDLVIGDVLGGSFTPAEECAPVLARLVAPLGVWSVLGNHDRAHDAERVRRALERAGIGVLDNAATRMGRDRPFWLAGIADDGTGDPDVPGTLAAVPAGAPVLALAHDPATFADMPERVALTLCGHTHGGQVHLPGLGAVIMPTRAPRRWAYGHVVESGRHLFVSGGVGTSVLPIRFNMPPEIVVLDVGPAVRSEPRPSA